MTKSLFLIIFFSFTFFTSHSAPKTKKAPSFFSKTAAFCKRAGAFVGLSLDPKTCTSDPEKVIRLLARGHQCGFNRLLRSPTFPCLMAFQTHANNYIKTQRDWPFKTFLADETEDQLIPMLMSVLAYILDKEEKDKTLKTTLHISSELINQALKSTKNTKSPKLTAILAARKRNHDDKLTVPVKNILDFFSAIVVTTSDSETGLALKSPEEIKEAFKLWIAAQLTEIAKS